MFAITQPLNNPINVVDEIPMTAAINGLTPELTIRYATNIFTKVTIDPTERSIPPMIITNIIPTDATPSIAACLATLRIFETVKNLGVAIENAIIKTTNTT